MSSLMRAMGIGAPKQMMGGFKVQTSIYGTPIPIVYGKARVAGNLIHMPDAPQQQGGGSKTGRASKGASGGQNYTAPVAIALAEGPIAGIGLVWRDKDSAVQYVGNYDSSGWSLFVGSSAQAAWSYLTTNHIAQAVPYVFTAYVVNPAAVLPNDSLSQYSWEVKGFFPFGGPNAVVDANGADIINDFLTSASHGANFPSTRLGDLTTYRAYVAAAGLFCSPVYDSSQPARAWLDELFEITNSGAVWSDGVLKIVPYGDTPLTGNGYTYTPNTTPLYDLGDNDFLPNGAVSISGDVGDQTTNTDLDPILVDRIDPAAAFNDVTVEYEDRLYNYNRVPVKYEDQYAIQTYGRIPMPTLHLHAIKDATIARQVAQIRGQRIQSVRNRYRFNLGWKYSLLEPMDLVTLTDSKLGLSLTPVRIVSIAELTGERGFDILAEDWPFGTATATLYGTGSASGFIPNTNADPGNTSTPVIVEGPDSLKGAPLELWIGAQGGADWGGCEVHFSTDNVNFQKVGNLVGKAIYGTTTALLNTGTAWPSVDNVNTLSVNIGTAGRTLASQSATDFAALTPLCYVGGEFLAYQTATLTSPGNYNLTSLYRGVWNSTDTSHIGGSTFMFIDPTVFKFPFAAGTAGQTVYFKFPAFNTFGARLQDIAGVASVAYTIGNNPTPLGNAAPQGTVSIAANGVWSASWDGPQTALSYRYATSTSAYPNDATTAASGTLVNGRAQTLTSAGTLSFGQTIFITIIPFTAVQGNGNQLPSIHLRGSYQTYTSTKSTTYSRVAWQDISGKGFTTDINNGIINPFLPSGTIRDRFCISILLPVGVTLVSASADVIWITVTQPLGGFQMQTFQGNTAINGASAVYGAGLQTITWSLGSTVTTSTALSFVNSWGAAFADADAGQAELGDVTLTYSMPDPLKTV
jgi:hypothetical protein